MEQFSCFVVDNLKTNNRSMVLVHYIASNNSTNTANVTLVENAWLHITLIDNLYKTYIKVMNII